MLKLIDLIGMAGVQLGNFKIHCATGNDHPPLNAFFAGSFQQWQAYQTRANFNCNTVVSLIHLGGSEWLFAGAWKVNGVQKRSKGGTSWFQYSTTELKGLEHLAGRAIVHFQKKFRQSYLNGARYADQLLVNEIRPLRMSVGDFPGYASVNVDYSLLQVIVGQELPSWKSALKSVSGVYVIADTSTGRLYVGSAYGEGGIWSRWVQYANSGHGGNKEFRRLIKAGGADYAHNFQFGILEVCDLMSSEAEVIEREVHWKLVLLTKEYGNNEN